MNMNKKTQTVPDWIEDILYHVVENYNGRKVVLWGKYSTSEYIADLLRDSYAIETECYIDNDVSKVDNCCVYPKEYILGKAREYYIVVPIGYYLSIVETLTEGGYISGQDYYYFCDCVITKTKDYYEDLHGNKIYGNYTGLKVVFHSFNATIHIGNNVKFEKCSLLLYSNVEMNIGSHTVVRECSLQLYSKARINIGDNSTLEDTQVNIGKNACMTDGNILICEKAELNIGDSFSVCQKFWIWLCDNTKINIGSDCMFSYNLVMRTFDGHSIFDVNTGENINSTEDIQKKRSIQIGNHVWIGLRCIILYNTVIGDGSIVGAGSLIKGKFPNNCILAGNPAKVIRQDVAWCRENGEYDIRECGIEYVKKTFL